MDDMSQMNIYPSLIDHIDIDHIQESLDDVVETIAIMHPIRKKWLAYMHKFSSFE